mmetsp:Transcript_4449/g.9716  ORF Transcript_4449/g.9716 Transcript_4449/m.9716 type:complete len:219 (-) Transcript_4449:540-1196(-)
MSFTLAPRSATTLAHSAMPPGRSLTGETRRRSLPSAERPRSITRPSIVVSMLPPHRGATTTLSLMSSRSSGPPGRSAARPAAPPPSTMTLLFSTRRSIATASSRSLTCTISSTQCRATAKACGPTCGTARPSASVELETKGTGSPASRAAVKEAQRVGSTPITFTFGLSVLTARATPAMRPAPPTGTTITSASGTCSSISMPRVPAPATISGSSKPLM